MRPFITTLILSCIFFSTLTHAVSLDDLVDTKQLDTQLKQSLNVLPKGPETAAGTVPLTGNLSDADEEALGREVAGRLLASYPLVKNDALQQYVNRVGRIVAARSPRPTLNWTFSVINSNDINAFSAPGGYVFITAGLYRLLENEAELAGVLGHEISHILFQHHVKLMQKSRAIEIGRDVLLGNIKNDSVKMLAGNGAEIYARALDKNAEFDCDRIGIQLAANAGYDPFAFIVLLDRMGSQAGNSDRLALLYKTHPHPADRLSALEQAIGSRWNNIEAGVTPLRMVKLAP